jgi:hypothetical protein
LTGFTPQELADMRRWDERAESEPLTAKEIRDSERRDRIFAWLSQNGNVIDQWERKAWRDYFGRKNGRKKSFRPSDPNYHAKYYAAHADYRRLYQREWARKKRKQRREAREAQSKTLAADRKAAKAC